MSTRSQIRFTGNNDITTQIYRHSDGYPEGVIPDLKKFFAWYESEPQARHGDSSYATADFIYFSKATLSEDLKKAGAYKIGMGVENKGEIHGDEEYLYTVDVDTHNVKVQEADEKLGFEKSKVLFEGSLDDAYKKYVAKKAKA